MAQVGLASLGWCHESYIRLVLQSEQWLSQYLSAYAADALT